MVFDKNANTPGKVQYHLRVGPETGQRLSQALGRHRRAVRSENHHPLEPPVEHRPEGRLQAIAQIDPPNSC